MTAACLPAGSPVSNIRLVGCDGGKTFHLYGDHAGDEGVELAWDGLEELYEPPIRVIERTPIRMDGGVLRAVKTAIMEPVVTLVIHGDHVNPFSIVDGEIREALSFELDPYYEASTLARIEWETADSTRYIEVVLTAGTKYDVEHVPGDHPRRGWWVWELHLKAYMPFWQEDDVVVPVQFDSDGTKTAVISNPSGVDMEHKYVGTAATYTLPDNTWSGPPWKREPGGMFPNRTLTYPDIDPVENVGITVDYSPGEIPVRDAFDHNMVAQMPSPGDYPKHPIPRFCQPVEIEVSATNVPPEGAVLMIHQVRRFRRAWGRV
ncbi:minor tail protein [Gordonia phage Stultus]|uniref:Minor tail protein n=9 Tax=Vividuovirus TaxID=2560251 RepID=A0A4Y6EL60_9CAUD|nr:minor tail protein [Gordonia phage Vivi2]YP_009622984.1 minor tail protein [Gordonia phage Brandonk123]YP_010096826.1 minor tail protein [Gordonia phage Rofo]YP_010099275.1 minor tail protein [Gordonia phage Fosterous]YP_010099443.1 minor tail protein [Gordonia phage Nordenberg]YP_010099531.1 minor tail protein [Gordonia phage Stultus]YP_010099613.1 minor tail protein [Gordonia phage Tangent]YP_010103326.1 minor tail protein [Gordonia phage McKinley]YP_010109490.1 minor tail protein [Gor